MTAVGWQSFWLHLRLLNWGDRGSPSHSSGQKHGDDSLADHGQRKRVCTGSTRRRATPRRAPARACMDGHHCMAAGLMNRRSYIILRILAKITTRNGNNSRIKA